MADSPPGRDRADRRNVGAVLASAGKTAFEILQADSVQRAAEALVSALAETGRTGTCVAWTEAQGLAFHPRQPDRTDQASWLLSTLALPGNTGPRVLCDDAVDAAAFLLDLDQVRLPPLTPAQEYLVALAERRIRELFAVERLSASVHRLAEAEKLQRALFTIADIAGSGHDMPSMLRRLHETIGQLMYAENFYIALLDESGENLQFPYFVDTMDSLPQASEPMASIAGGLTWYVLRDGVPLMGTIDQLRQQVSGPLDVIGASSEDWLGVPMLRDGKSVGALVVQSYLPGVGYTEADLAVLTFVADHVLTALERKRDQAELEQRVAIRTRQLAEANHDLELRIAERERARHLQETLYRIARLTHGEDDDDGFYQQIHGAVAELINAENFYIALLSEDGTMLHFPYHRDQAGGIPTSRPVGRGLTEHVIRLGEALLTDETGVRQLVADGVLEHNLAMSTPAMCWLGVPLADGERVMGAVVVQSYRSDLRYEHEDAELLKFVSYQIATSLQRRNHAESLRRLNAELESRVQSRTRELREQIAVREQVEERLKHQVMHDPLTGLPNRVYLRDRIERAIAARLRDPGRGFALMYLDVDRFKLFNDSLGHLAGDEVLREVARRLGQSVRDPDVVARLSGDEFAILIEDDHLPQTACKVAQRILNTLQHPMTIAGRELQASASIGIAIGADTHRNTDEILHDADVALYRAKEAGRQRFVLFDESLQKSAMDVLEIERQVRAGLAHGEFIPYFQPIVRLADGATVGYEALARWRHPQRARSGRVHGGGRGQRPHRATRLADLSRQLRGGSSPGPGGRLPDHQPLGPPFPERPVRCPHAGPAVGNRLRPAPASHRGHRGHAAGRHRRRGAHPRAPARRRGDGGAGRLRHRLFLAGLRAPLPAGHDQDRSILHRAPGRQRRRTKLGHHRRGAGPGPVPEAGRRGRRRGNRGPARRAGGDGLHARPGLLVRQAAGARTLAAGGQSRRHLNPKLPSGHYRFPGQWPGQGPHRGRQAGSVSSAA